jgi:hypothetical protein
VTSRTWRSVATAAQELTGQVARPLSELLLFARSGFSAELKRVADSRPDVELVDLDRLCNGT